MGIEKLPKPKGGIEKYGKPGYTVKERYGKMVHYTNGKDDYVVDEQTGRIREVPYEPMGATFKKEGLTGIPNIDRQNKISKGKLENKQGGTFNVGGGTL